MTKNRFGDFFHPIFAVDLVYDFMISVNNVSVVFGGFYLLDSVSFLINKKDRIGLTGRNGAGKSTTLKMLAGLQIPSEGNISMASDINPRPKYIRMEIPSAKRLKRLLPICLP